MVKEEWGSNIHGENVPMNGPFPGPFLPGDIVLIGERNGKSLLNTSKGGLTSHCLVGL